MNQEFEKEIYNRSKLEYKHWKQWNYDKIRIKIIKSYKFIKPLLTNKGTIPGKRYILK